MRANYIFRRVLLCILLLVLLVTLCSMPAYASSDSPSAAVSSQSTEPGDFTPADDVPYGVEIPEFYLKIENAQVLYMFVGSDGTVHKRIYGTLDGVTGWYAAHGTDNVVYKYSTPVNIQEDYALLPEDPYAGVSSTYIGILPPEEGVTEVDEIFGADTRQFITIAVAVMLGLVLIITLGGVMAGRRKG